MAIFIIIFSSSNRSDRQWLKNIILLKFVLINRKNTAGMLELLWYFSGVQNMPELRVSLCDVSKIDYSCIFWLISLITLKFCSTSNADEQKTLHFVYQAVLFVLLKLSIVESPMGIISWGSFSLGGHMSGGLWLVVVVVSGMQLTIA